MISFWERESFTQYDIIIIGSGIVGLSAAISIKEKYPQRSVLVLERGLMPSGASTRNAGFTTFGGVGELLSDLNRMPEAAVLDQVIKRWEGLRMLRERCGDEHIDYHNYGGYEFVFNNEAIGLPEIERINSLLMPVFNEPAFRVDKEAVPKFGFNKNFIRLCMFSPFEGQIHSGKMMQRLLWIAHEKKVQILTGANVLEYHITKGKGEVLVSNPVGGGIISFLCEQLIFCTNAFTGDFFPGLDIIPGRGQVLVTKPLRKIPFKGIFQFDEGFFYFRNVGNRVLLGGGRNLDFEKEKTKEFGITDTVQQKLEYYLKNLILPRQDYEVDMRWSGIMAFGKDKMPIIKRINEHVIIGARMNGIGVAIGTLVGKEISNLL
jgi:glycine/D-amino acid oxidase-like deaminating enzyme